MKVSELKKLSEKELNKILEELKKVISKEKLKMSMGSPENSGKYRETKRTIARILTIFNEKGRQVKKA